MAQDDVKEILEELRKDLKEVKGTLTEVKDTQENRVLPSVIRTESILVGYADAYKTNKANIERLDGRVAALEDNAGIIPPPELTIQR